MNFATNIERSIMYYATNIERARSWIAEAAAAREAKMYILAAACEAIANEILLSGD